MISVKELSFSYALGTKKVHVLQKINFHVAAGEFVGIQGPSGSGKSTLFYILGLLLKPTAGEIWFDGVNITKMSEDELAFIRNKRLGFVFQQFHLLPSATCMQNVLLPTLYPCEVENNNVQASDKAKSLLTKLHLHKHFMHHPNQLSGGQQQRVAIARALINDVELILADEPTGNLDSKTALTTMQLLKELNQQGKTIILITHDSNIATHCARIYHLQDGAFTHVENNHEHELFLPENNIPKTELRTISNIPKTRRYTNIIKNLLPIVITNMFRNKIKTLLTILGVIIGVAAVLITITLGHFAKEKILETYEALGVNKINLHASFDWNMKASATYQQIFHGFSIEEDLAPLARTFAEIAMFSPMYITQNNNAVFAGNKIEHTVELLGITSEYFFITNRKILSGQLFSWHHVNYNCPVCVIGYDIAKILFKNSAIGESLNINDGSKINFSCKVIGVLKSVDGQQFNINQQVFLPYTYFTSLVPPWFKIATSAVISIKPKQDISQASKKIKAYFQEKYGNSAQFNVDPNSMLISQMKKFLHIFIFFLATIACVILIVGGIGINNMILVSINERIKEFGIRKALGATNRSIRCQVLLESTMICLLAGILGILIGFGLYEIIIFLASIAVANLKFTIIILPKAILFSGVVTITVGILSGLMPALKAERLEIIDALRQE